MEFVRELLARGKSMSHQLTLLRGQRNHPEVKQYMKELEAGQLSNYQRYLIQRYYYGNKTIKAPFKDGLEAEFVTRFSVEDRNPKGTIESSDLKVGDEVFYLGFDNYPHLEGIPLILEKINIEKDTYIVSYVKNGKKHQEEIFYKVIASIDKNRELFELLKK